MPSMQGSHLHEAVHSHNPYGTHGHGVEHSHAQVAADTSCNYYYTTTARKYYISPIEGGGTTVNVCGGLLFMPGNPVYVSNFDLSGSYFKAIVSEYDKTKGEISLKNITNIRGQFTGEYIYTISIIFDNPEVFELQEQMRYLFKYVFNINLLTDLSYVTPSLDLVDVERGIYMLYIYFFDINIRVGDPNYKQDPAYFESLANNLYLYLFEVDITSTNITITTDAKTDTLTNKVFGLFLYLFDIDLATTTNFNPNSTLL